MFFGGARGGGKTDGVLGKWALKEQRYGAKFNAIMFRRTTVSSEDAIERSKDIFKPLGGKFNESKLIWRMPNGGRVAFAYLDSIKDAEEYQGRNVTDAWVEEAGQYPDPAPIDRLFGVLRSAGGVPVQLILTANPGGAGQHWIAARYQLIPFPSGPKVVSRDLPNGSVHKMAVIPSRITDNRVLLHGDPGYINRLHLVGTAALVRAWLDGDWSAIEGAFFDKWSSRNVVSAFDIPPDWTRFRSFDWGSAKPFSVGWWAVAGDEQPIAGGNPGGNADAGRRDHRVIPRGALVRYREWYGASAPDKGLKLTTEEVARGIVERTGSETITYSVADPAIFTEDGGPARSEIFSRHGVWFRPADNKRIARAGAMGGWDEMRQRIQGDDGKPMLYVFDSCKDFLRTVPVLQHDPMRAEDLDTSSEDHCFVASTLVSTDKGLYSIADLIGKNGRVLSHDGEWHEFQSARLVKRDQPIVRLAFSDGSAVECTPDHKFLTATGWAEAKDLRGRAILSLSTPRRRNSTGEDITSVGDTTRTRASVSIARFGSGQTGLSRKGGTSTISTTIEAITHSLISNACRRLLTWVTGMARPQPSAGGFILSAPHLLLAHGIAAQRVASGTSNNTATIAPRPSILGSSLCAANAQPNTTPLMRGFAPTSANLHGAERLGLMTSAELATCAEPHSSPIDIPRSGHAREIVGLSPAHVSALVCLSVSGAGRSNVYCLTVPDTGNFALANGAIVANCADETRYACMSRPWVRPSKSQPPQLPRDYVSMRRPTAGSLKVL